ncbi:hypothetical protein BIV57_20895 [Mangrovactinospora gilvigrisea]|uniref:Indole-3-glycerol phosphate synthase n=1 Tax=Mangrovactinospora gilvigrisea TaxID=1428644 RepID=A0A1J7BAF5_9ACTN|nr:hypothetical protein [Mangrovactinospora gilvigrisea]OIV35581.1 hypothetical protein BIV57_20895 [Mangrovactinospora gilvigrisea]
MPTSILLIERPLDDKDVETVAALHPGAPAAATPHRETPGSASPDPYEETVLLIVLMQPPGAQVRLLRQLDDSVAGAVADAAPAGGAAARGLADTLDRLRAAGCRADGWEVDGADPLATLRAAVRDHRAEEVLVITEPGLVAKFFHHDWASRARRRVGVPALRLYAHADAAAG